MKNMVGVDKPPTELELAELLSTLPEPHKNIVRRLAFQRDQFLHSIGSILSWAEEDRVPVEKRISVIRNTARIIIEQGK